MPASFKPVQLSDIGPLSKVQVGPDQQSYVAPNEITIAQARFEVGSFDFCIWDGETRVGLIALIDMSMYPDRAEMDHPEAVYVWRLLIGSEHQGKGYGSAALTFAEEWGRARGLTRAQIQAAKSNMVAIEMYQRRGYTLTGLEDDGEVQLEKLL